MNITEKWLLCPSCGCKTRVRLRQDTELKNFLLFCPKCKQEMLVSVTKFITTRLREPDAKTQSR
ncbi:cysteine-rich KTR domain-containing protein [Frisingicoccus sp.]|uniref:cysteine-rich KTR domain-containing protein n=1 Tax=Frisingicoccus sp. TaxID=1918627 RepID=UPI003AB3F08C